MIVEASAVGMDDDPSTKKKKKKKKKKKADLTLVTWMKATTMKRMSLKMLKMTSTWTCLALCYRASKMKARTMRVVIRTEGRFNLRRRL